MYTYSIEHMYASAYEEAITQVADILNSTLGTNYTYIEDWAVLDMLAEQLGVQFDENGNIIK